eukprot:m.6237 g.6237  ORF g.6237 m.6237 type:complete len:386 (-) comp5139_c0_seq2:474-1631(-)
MVFWHHWQLRSDAKDRLLAYLNLSNKVTEILVTLLGIYLITELHAVPRGCDHYDCLNVYSAFNSTDEQPDLFIRDCGEQREACFYSFARVENFEKAKDCGLMSPETVAVFEPLVEYCRCLLGQDEDGKSVYYNFQAVRSIFFAISILGVVLMEVTTTVRGFRSPPLRAVAYSMQYVVFIAVKIYFAVRFNNDEVNSFEFELDITVINGTVFSSLVVLSIVMCAEIMAWRHAYTSAVPRQRPYVAGEDLLTKVEHESEPKDAMDTESDKTIHDDMQESFQTMAEDDADFWTTVGRGDIGDDSQSMASANDVEGSAGLEQDYDTMAEDLSSDEGEHFYDYGDGEAQQLTSRKSVSGSRRRVTFAGATSSVFNPDHPAQEPLLSSDRS